MPRDILSGLDISLQKTGYFAWLRLPGPCSFGDCTRLSLGGPADRAVVRSRMSFNDQGEDE